MSIILNGTLEVGSIWPKLDGTYNLGTASYRWKDFYLTGWIYNLSGIDFPEIVRDDLIRLWGTSYLIGIRSWTWFAQSNTKFQFKTLQNNTSLNIFELLDSTEAIKGKVDPDFNLVWGAHIQPMTDNVYDLGNSGYRWRNGYIKNLKLSRFLDYIDELVSEDDVGITAYVSMVGGTTYVVAFEDNTVVYVNGTFQGVINSGARLSLTLTAGDVVSANKPIMVHSNNERHAPITWKSTKFVIPFYRSDNQVIYIYALDANANVDVYVGNATTPTTSTTVTKGTATSVSLAVSPPKTVILESDALILVAVASYNGSYDFRFVHPPAKNVVGTPSGNIYISALEDNTTITWYQGNNSGTYTLNRGDIVDHATLGISGGSQYNATPVRVIADKPIMISSFADGDGSDATCGLPPRVLPTKMVLPVAAQWLSIAVPYPNTVIRIYYQGVLKYETIVSSSYSYPLSPALLYLNPTDIDTNWTSIPYGTVIEADKPVYVVFDCAEVWTNDETVLLGINSRKWRFYINPTLSLTTDLVPPQDNTRDLGSSSYRWRYGHFTHLKVSHSLDDHGTYIEYSPGTPTATRELFSVGDPTKSPSFVIYWARYTTPEDKLMLGTSWCPVYFRGQAYPNVDNTYDLGSSSYRWRKAYMGSFIANLSDSYIDAYGLVIGNTSGRASGERLELWGGTSSMILSVQDGNGRIQLKWNATRGTGEKFLVGGEPAAFWQFDPITPNTDLFRIQYADGSGASAGDTITWDNILQCGLSGLKIFKSGIFPGSDNALDSGSPTLRWRKLYAVDAYFGDVNFENGWKIVEAEKLNMGEGLILVAPNGKKYRFKLEEVNYGE